MKTCIGGAYIYSGRSDPTWHVERAVEERLKRMWDLLDSFSEELPSPPKLGYRGCFLRCSAGLEWFAYGSVVTLKKKGKHESRKDIDRKFERLLLSSDPEGLLPPSLLENHSL